MSGPTTRNMNLTVRLSPSEYAMAVAAARIRSHQTGARIGAGTVLRLGGLAMVKDILEEDRHPPKRRSEDARP